MARVSIALLGLSIALLTWAGDAFAATVKVQANYQKAAHTSDGVHLRASPGEANDVAIAQAGPLTIAVTDSVPLEAGPGCTSQSTFQALCTTTEFVSVVLDIRLGDGDDSARASGVAAFPAKLFGGPGDDHLVGLTSGLNRFSGGPGDDLMEGGPWTDTFLEDDRRNGSDTMLGGSPGSPPPLLSDDEVDYGKRRQPVRVSFDGRANDGAARERDLIAADIERVVGGSGADVMVGNELANGLTGGSGRDLLRGGAGDDWLVGDEYLARPKREEDVIRGGPGDDHVEGGDGADRLSTGSGHDAVVAGAGDDRVRTRDRIIDAVLCGEGEDRVLHDRTDFLSYDCERQGSRIPAGVVPLFWAHDVDRLSLVLGCPYRRGVRCQGTATLEVGGQTVGPHSFSLRPGRYAWLFVAVGDLSLDGAVVTLESAGKSVAVPLSAVHRDPTPASFFLPPVYPFL